MKIGQILALYDAMINGFYYVTIDRTIEYVSPKEDIKIGRYGLVWTRENKIRYFPIKNYDKFWSRTKERLTK